MATYVHDIDPIIGTILGVHLWWYGLTYVLGFMCVFVVLKARQDALGLSQRGGYRLTLLITAGVLIGGRLVQVIFYERLFYLTYPELVPAYWLGGMASHGLLFGGLLGILLFCRLDRRRVLPVSDVLSVAGAFILGVGRLGNFIDGQIVGGVTDVPWAVKFPDAKGWRHPVVLYDGAKNLLLIPLLLYLGRRPRAPGFITGMFLFLYAFLRIFTDLFREYSTTLLGLATGQTLNILMSIFGLALMAWSMRRRETQAAGRTPPGAGMSVRGSLLVPRSIFIGLLLFSLTVPSDWTQDIPARYGKRHPGLEYSVLYPRIDRLRAALNCDMTAPSGVACARYQAPSTTDGEPPRN